MLKCYDYSEKTEIRPSRRGRQIACSLEERMAIIMDLIEEKFKRLGVDNAPGQEINDKTGGLELRGEALEGAAVDFSHGDVDAHPPIPGSLECFDKGFAIGGHRAYTEYRGDLKLREGVAARLSAFTGCKIDPAKNLIFTPGTQGALFLAMGSLVARGDKVAIVEPDYFANRKLVEFFEGELVPVRMHYETAVGCAGLDLAALEKAFQSGVKLFLFSNPNNPTGVIYSPEEIRTIAALAGKYGATLLVDELYSRQIFDGRTYTHLCAQPEAPENLITIIGPSKTESVSGFRLGAAFGSEHIIRRMEKLQAIVSLRAAGYCQSIYDLWFNEPEGWLQQRVADHQTIRDDLLGLLRSVPGVKARTTEGGSYLFTELPELDVDILTFVKLCRQYAHVSVTPGTEFGPQFTHHFRINFSQDAVKAHDAIQRLLMLMERYRK